MQFSLRGALNASQRLIWLTKHLLHLKCDLIWDELFLLFSGFQSSQALVEKICFNPNSAGGTLCSHFFPSAVSPWNLSSWGLNYHDFFHEPLKTTHQFPFGNSIYPFRAFLLSQPKNKLLPIIIKHSAFEIYAFLSTIKYWYLQYDALKTSLDLKTMDVLTHRV